MLLAGDGAAEARERIKVSVAITRERLAVDTPVDEQTRDTHMR